MRKDLTRRGRVILAEGEQTGHCHEVLDAVTLDMPAAQFFEEPDGRRVLLVERPCVLRHQEHGPITLDPTRPEQYRQGDVLLQPMGLGTWQVIQQQEWAGPEQWRQVLD